MTPKPRQLTVGWALTGSLLLVVVLGALLVWPTPARTLRTYAGPIVLDAPIHAPASASTPAR